MPIGRQIAACLADLGLLASDPSQQKKSHWSDLARRICEQFDQTVEEIVANDGSAIDEGVVRKLSQCATTWVDEYGLSLWSEENRVKLEEHAPSFPAEETFIRGAVRDILLRKLHNLHHNARKGKGKAKTREPSIDAQYSSQHEVPHPEEHIVHSVEGNEPEVQLTDEDQVWEDMIQSIEGNGPEADTADEEQGQTPDPSDNGEHHDDASDEDEGDDSSQVASYHSPERNDILPIVPANPHPLQRLNTFRPHLNTFMDRTNFPTVEFPPFMLNRVFFHVRAENSPTARTYMMHLNEAQNVDTFWVGIIDRLHRLGVREGSDKVIVAQLEFPTVIDTDYDHHSMLQTIKFWPGWYANDRETYLNVVLTMESR